MSITLEVWPRSTQLPTTEIVLDHVRAKFLERCQRIGIKKVPDIALELYSKLGSGFKAQPWTADQEFHWWREDFVWLHAKGHDGGTNIRYRENTEFEVEYWNKDVVACQNRTWSIPALLDCLKPGHHWSLRSGAGNTGAGHILCAIAAGCVADLTNGAVWSGDGGLPKNQGPMTGREALSTLMNPRARFSREYRRLAADVENALINELTRQKT